MKKHPLSKVISFVLCFAVLIGTVSVGAAAANMPDAIGDTTKLKFPFAFFRSEPNLSVSTIKGVLLWTDELTVLGYAGSFVRVELSKNNEGYVHRLIIKDKRLNIKKQYANIYSGVLKDDYVQFKFDLDDTVTWSLDKKGIVEVTKYNNRSFSVKGLSPGVVKLTVKTKDFKDTCEIACIEKWADTETATAQSDIDLMGVPGKKYTPEVTITQGSTIIARGHIPGYSDYVYVSSGDKWGFIKLSDFPAIKHVMTQYHYYDKGYDLRFSSASSKISDYASVLNDVMMANFGLKVYYNIEPYTSAADQCKIWKSGSVKTGNLSNSCPKTGNHNSASCLRTAHIRDKLLADKGWGTNVLTKAVWTGHIMDGHKPSTSESTTQTIVFTTANTVSYSSGTYSNKSSSNIRYYSLYEITHETGHQLGLVDGYCYKDGNGKHCSNNNCFSCNGAVIPNCIMAQIKSPTNSTNMFCDDCKEKINSHLKDHH